MGLRGPFFVIDYLPIFAKIRKKKNFMSSIINYIKTINLSQQVTSFLLGKSQQQSTIIEKKNEIINMLLKKDDITRDLKDQLLKLSKESPEVKSVMDTFISAVEKVDLEIDEAIKEAHESESKLKDDCVKFEDKYLSS